MLKIATWNVNSLKIRLDQVLTWCEKNQPDMLALQETKTTDENFPNAAIEAAGYHAIFSGEKAYNGVAILSKMKPLEIETHVLDDQKRIIIATIAQIRVINLYVPNGQSVVSEKYIYKLNWLDNIQNYLWQALKNYEHCVVLGDFNIAPKPEDVHDPNLWEGQVLFSMPERNAFQRLLDLGLQDTFRLFTQPEKIFTWWDYRQLAMQKNRGLRIDHILATQNLAKFCKKVYVDKAMRKLPRPSDHAPVIAEFELDPDGML